MRRVRFVQALALVLLLQWGGAFAHCPAFQSAICSTTAPQSDPGAKAHPVCPICCQLAHVAMPAPPACMPLPVLLAPRLAEAGAPALPGAALLPGWAWSRGPPLNV